MENKTINSEDIFHLNGRPIMPEDFVTIKVGDTLFHQNKFLEVTEVFPEQNRLGLKEIVFDTMPKIEITNNPKEAANDKSSS